MPTSVPEPNADGTTAVSGSETPTLELCGLVAGYGGDDILHGVDLVAYDREIVCVVGPNGSGKSTVFKSVYGLIPLKRGSVVFQGTDVTGQSPQHLLRSGVAMVPQLSTIFPLLTVQENLELGMYVVRDKPRIRRRVDEILDLFPRLAARRSQDAGTLSGGERRALEIGRSLMLDPRLLLMDEPSVGLSPKLVREVFEQLVELRDNVGITLVLIEQNARTALQMADRGYVIERGRVTYQGTGEALLADPDVRRAFLGG